MRLLRCNSTDEAALATVLEIRGTAAPRGERSRRQSIDASARFLLLLPAHART